MSSLRKLCLESTCLTAVVAAAFTIAASSQALAQQKTPDLDQVYAIVKTLQDRVNTLEAQNRKSQRETKEAREEADRARAEAKDLRRRFGAPAPARAPYASVGPAPAVAPVIGKAPAVEAVPYETIVTAVAAPLPNYYTIGVTPFATLPPNSPVVPAVVPIRVLPTGVPELDSLTRGLRLSDNIVFQPYGTITATWSHDSSSPYGLPYPLPGFIGNVNGPDAFPASHLNARDSIFGATAIWRDAWHGLSVTGKAEMDLNGDFSGANAGLNSVQSLSSYSPRVRLAYGRVDAPVTATTDVFLLAGQDWTPFASSTQPHILDTGSLAAGFGNIWARLPQIRAGFAHDFGTPANLRFQLEGAVVQPGWGNTPGPIFGGFGNNLFPSVNSNMLTFGERQGADADQPEIQGRGVLQFQLDPAEGVAPAQLIASGMAGKRTADVLASQVPAAFQAAFPSGAQLSTTRWGWTLEAQLPTRFVTVSGKYYQGTGLRFYGGGQFFGEFNNLTGLINTATAPTIDNSNTLVFGLRNGVPVLADQSEPHSSGGFVSIGLPFSRWVGADPHGYGAGWTGFVSFGRDQVNEDDVKHLGGGREASDFWAAQLQYRPVPNLIFGVEVSRYQTHAIPLTATGLCPLFTGMNTCDWSDNRVVGSVTVAY